MGHYLHVNEETENADVRRDITSSLDDPEVLAFLRLELDELYAEVPATTCASSGECCALTEQEMVEGYATMFPLYQAEYANIVHHVRSQFTSRRQEELLSLTQERPQRCPFLAADNHCTIYPVRPLICRTYAVMNPESIAEAVQRHEGEAPETWIRRFARREGGMVCPRVVVTQPEKLVRHVRNLITSAYERTLVDLSRRTRLVGGERREVARQVIKRRNWPVRWTWGGFNSIAFTSMDWLKTHFRQYWRKSELADSG